MREPLRIAMLGMIEGNGHPYSWSAIINGYDSGEMQRCPYPAIPAYLDLQPEGSVGIAGVKVTHIWTDDPSAAEQVARASRIEAVVSAPEEVIGKVDAVILATDDGNDHVRRARPFVESGIPVFIDKPLAVNVGDLATFWEWHRRGAVFLSSSGMRYAAELRAGVPPDVGNLRWVTSVTVKTWERYGIHALEAVQPLLGPGFGAVRCVENPWGALYHLEHHSGVPVTIAVAADALGSIGAVHFYGTLGQRAVLCRDYYSAFRAQLVAFFDMLWTGRVPIDFYETAEMMAVLIAGVRSRAQAGIPVRPREVLSEANIV
jgi:hypothetical protein